VTGEPTPVADGHADARRAPAPSEWGRVEFARAWATVLDGTSYITLAPAEIEVLTLSLSDLLVAAAFDEPFTAKAGERVGQALVDAHYTGTKALSRTTALLGDLLLPCLGRSQDGWLRPRISDLQGAVAAGYSQALLALALAEQEQIRQAALAARDRAEAALRASDARFRALFTDAAVGIGVGDVAGNILDVNPALVKMLGYPPAEFRRRNVADFLHPDDAAAVWADYRDLVEGERDSFRTEKPFFRADGTQMWTHLTVSLIRGDDGTPRYQVAIMEDITDRRQLRDRLTYQATHDPLTGLPNRAMFLDRLAEALGPDERGAEVALCFLDLDSFKVINDSLGHSVGDQLLVAVSERLAAQVDPSDLIARIGGDEFVVLVAPSTGRDRLTELTDRLLAVLGTPIPVEGHQLSLSASIGVVEAPAGRSTPTDLIRAADITLQQAKSDGKGRAAFHDPDRNASQVTLYTLAATLPGALDRGEFVLAYQPLVRLKDERLHGVEALLRWQHPRFGLLTPDQFIQLAEETGAILPLGRWILTESCRQAARWSSLVPDDSLLSVNIAVRQLQHPGLVEDITRALAETGLPTNRLQLEVTESVLMTADADEPLAALRKLADMGVRIAIDDFGTGYSNLAYLRRLPVHELKLAGAFLDGLRAPGEPDPADVRVVAAVIDIAHTLRLTVTAEAVETVEQANRLRELGCDTAQGWYYAPPTDPDRLTAEWGVQAAGGPLDAR
jgi:diguanylate cyclase (GGDEF)-like protein/PAS domain S-box-containing protein